MLQTSSKLYIYQFLLYTLVDTQTPEKECKYNLPEPMVS